MTDADKLIEAAKDALQCFPLCLPTFPKTDRLEDETAIRMAEAAIRAVLAELERQGWVCVPTTPTREMLLLSDDGEEELHYISEAWPHVLAAAPKLEVG